MRSPARMTNRVSLRTSRLTSYRRNMSAEHARLLDGTKRERLAETLREESLVKERFFAQMAHEL